MDAPCPPPSAWHGEAWPEATAPPDDAERRRRCGAPRARWRTPPQASTPAARRRPRWYMRGDPQGKPCELGVVQRARKRPDGIAAAPARHELQGDCPVVKVAAEHQHGGCRPWTAAYFRLLKAYQRLTVARASSHLRALDLLALRLRRKRNHSPRQQLLQARSPTHSSLGNRHCGGGLTHQNILYAKVLWRQGGVLLLSWCRVYHPKARLSISNPCFSRFHVPRAGHRRA